MPAHNLFSAHQPTLTGPATVKLPVTPGTSEQPYVWREIYCGTGGTVVARGQNGVDVTYTNVASGARLPGFFTHILPATTATGLIGEV